MSSQTFLVIYFVAHVTSMTRAANLDVKPTLLANDDCSLDDSSLQCHLGLLQSTAGKILTHRRQQAHVQLHQPANLEGKQIYEAEDHLTLEEDTYVAATLVKNLQHLNRFTINHGDQDKCEDSPAAYVDAWAASQNYGNGMTCAQAKKKGHCYTLSQICKATCGICDQPEYSSGFTVGETVSWSNHTDGVPTDAVGVVYGFTPEKVKVKFPGGAYAMYPKELKKTQCKDAPPAHVSRWAASQYYGEDMTCTKVKEAGLCKDMTNYCAATCNFCEHVEEHVRAKQAAEKQSAEAVDPVEQDKEAAAQLVAGLARMGAVKQENTEKCEDGPPAFVSAWAASQGLWAATGSYGNGMTCADAKKQGHCRDLSEICKASCGICDQAEYSSGLSIGDSVAWMLHNDKVPKDAVGLVAGFTEDKVKVMFPTGTYNIDPKELEKAECKDAIDTRVAHWAAFAQRGDGDDMSEAMTCDRVKEKGLCKDMRHDCAATCGFCADMKQQVLASKVPLPADQAETINPLDLEKSIAAHLVADLAKMGAAKQDTPDKCEDAPEAFVSAWAASLGHWAATEHYGRGMTCADAKKEGHCGDLSEICKASCGICSQAEYSSGFGIGESVNWMLHTDKVPKDAVGVVFGFTEDKVKVKFPGGSYNIDPKELQKAQCADAPEAHVAHWAAFVRHGGKEDGSELMTCDMVKTNGLCQDMSNPCAATCGFCEHMEKKVEAKQTKEADEAEQEQSAARLVAGLARIGAAKQGDQEKCEDSPAVYIDAWAATQNIGKGLTCDDAKDLDHCYTVSQFCKATCGICEQPHDDNQAAEKQAAEVVDPIEQDKDVAAQLVANLVQMKDQDQDKCEDSPAAYVEAWAASQNYGQGMTCADAKDQGHCYTLSQICKATCGICDQPEYSSGFSVGEVVSWTNQTDGVPKDAVGVVYGFTPEKVKVKFPGGAYAMYPKELKKTQCKDAPAAHVSRWAASQYYGEDMTCDKVKEAGLCKDMTNYCAATCKFCEHVEEHVHAKQAAEQQAAEAVDPVEQDKEAAAQLMTDKVDRAKKAVTQFLSVDQNEETATQLMTNLRTIDLAQISVAKHQAHVSEAAALLLGGLAQIRAAKQADQEKCEDSPAAYVDAWAASQNYGKGMTCAAAKKQGHCYTLSQICKATCGICDQPEYSSGFAVGETVSWSNHTDGVPKDAVGVVYGFTPEKVKVKFPGGAYAMYPKELKKTECKDAPAAHVSRWAASQYYGEDMTCNKVKDAGLCNDMTNYCAATCNFCEHVEEHVRAKQTAEKQAAEAVDPVEQDKEAAAQLMTENVGRAKQAAAQFFSRP